MSFFFLPFFKSLKYICPSRIKFSTLNILHGTSFIHSLTHSQGPLHARQFINKKNRANLLPSEDSQASGRSLLPSQTGPQDIMSATMVECLGS